MGRHSRPDEGSEDSFEGAAVGVAAPGVQRGRHSRSDEDQSRPIGFEDIVKIARIELVDATVAEPAPPAIEEPAVNQLDFLQPRSGARELSTTSDFALVRAHGDVRARVIAAVIIPFALYTAGLAVMGKLDRSYLLWIWIPLITAGVLGGLFLDIGHRKYNR